MEQKTILKTPGNKKNIDETDVTSRLLNMIFDMPVDQQLELLDYLDSNGYSGSRRHERTFLKSPWLALVGQKNELHESFIVDVSRCGMFIETSCVFRIGEKITMKFQVPSSKKIFRIVGEIVRSNKNGVGVKYKRQLS